MKKYARSSINIYLEKLSEKTPTPGGGSAAACAGAMGVALIEMAARYSAGKCKTKSAEKRIKMLLKECKAIKKRLIELIDRDAQVYVQVVKTRKSSFKKKEAALKGARKVPQEICRLCYKAIQLTPLLVQEGNQRLISDIEVAVEMLLASYNSARINILANI